MSWHLLEAAAIIASPFAVVWVWRASFRPMAPCRKCGGQRRVGDGERWRNVECPRCGGSGERMTLSARIVRGPGRWDR